MKNTSSSHTLFKLKCKYYPHVWFEDDANPHFRSHSGKKLAKKLKDLISIC